MSLPNKRNSGYSLIELIVVISIMAVMVGVSSLGLSMMFSKDAETVAKELDNEIAEARTMAMSKPGNFTLTIKSDSEGVGTSMEMLRQLDGEPDEVETIDFSKKAYLKIKKDATEEGTLLEGKNIVIKFNKSNGSVKEFSVDGTDRLSDDMCIIECKSVKLADKTKNVYLMFVTGRHYTD